MRGALVPGRSILVAAVLSGLGPGAGHSYVGKPARGAFLVALLTLAAVVFAWAAPVSYDAFRLALLPLLVLPLLIIVDAAQLARRSPRPCALAPWQRWWTHAGIVALTGVAAPALLASLLGRQAAIVQVPDDSMDPRVLEGDWLVVERTTGLRGLERGDVAVAARPGSASIARRLVGLPGERVGVQRGLATVEGRELPLALSRPLLAQDLHLDARTLGPDEVLLLGDRRRREEAADAIVPVAALRGRASWILLPVDLDALRIGVRP